ncbi:MAG: GGDEF domain-containing protein [Chromatiales bacterium]|jgi:diguanylate cyclase (GGDEF)-like protein
MIKKYHSIAGVVRHTHLMIAVILLLAATALGLFLQHTFTQQEQARHRAQSNQLAAQLENRLEWFKQQGQLLAADPQLQRAVASGKSKRIENWTSNMAPLVPDLIGLAVFDPAYRLIGDAEKQHVTEQCIEHVAAIGNDKEYIKLDVHNHISELSHFEFVLPIGKTGHWLLLSFSTEAISNYLRDVGGAGSPYYEVTTPSRGLVVRVGENAGNHQVQLQVGAHDWRLLSRQQLPSIYPASLMPLAAIAGTVLLLLLVNSWLGWQQVRFFKDDLEQLDNALQANEQEGKPLLGTNIYLKEFYELHRRISHMLQELRESRSFINEQSLKDVFTGLSNERAFHKSQARFFNMAKRQMPVSMVLMDIDDLAQINKRIGHESGDEVIKGLAGILQASVRDSDECFHLSGGRFVVVMVDMEIADALKWYEFLTRRFEVLEQQVAGFRKAGLKLGVSAAAAMATSGDSSMEDTLIRCEEVLRSVKKQCKGIIVTAREPAAQRQQNSFDAPDAVDNVLKAEFHHPWQ